MEKLGCHGNINIDVLVMARSKCSQLKFKEKSAKFGGPSLHCFEVIQLFSELGPQKLPPDLNGVKEDYSK